MASFRGLGYDMSSEVLQQLLGMLISVKHICKLCFQREV
jgi:hypothetical protein